MNTELIISSLSPSDFLASVAPAIPEFFLLALGSLVLLGGTFRENRPLWGWISFFGLVTALALALRPIVNAPIDGNAYHGPLVYDGLSQTLRMLTFLCGAGLILMGWEEGDSSHVAERSGLILFATAGTSLCVAANDLPALFLALELVSIPTYLILFLTRGDKFGRESTLKYFLLSVFSSALMLFGFSYLYGITGSLRIPEILAILSESSLNPVPEAVPTARLVGLVMVVAGLGFKVTAVPFHFYAPDVYQGTSNFGASLLSTLPKIAGFAALARLTGLTVETNGGVFLPFESQSSYLFWILASVTMTLGNVIALWQTNLRRLFAYSGIAHAGYMLVALSVGREVGATGALAALVVYLWAYVAMTLGVFAIFIYLDKKGKHVEKVEHLNGLAKTDPVAGGIMVVLLLSLIGLPLTAGFLGKLALVQCALRRGLESAITEAHPNSELRLFFGLALMILINAAIAGWYYLRMIGALYLRKGKDTHISNRPVASLVTAFVCVLVTIAVGVLPGLVTRGIGEVPWHGLKSQAVMGDPLEKRSGH